MENSQFPNLNLQDEELASLPDITAEAAGILYVPTGNFEPCEKNTAQVQFHIDNYNGDKSEIRLHYNHIKEIVNYLFMNIQEKDIREALQRDLFSELPTQEGIDEMWADLES